MSIRSSGNLWPFSPILVSSAYLIACATENVFPGLAVEHKIYAALTIAFIN